MFLNEVDESTATNSPLRSPRSNRPIGQGSWLGFTNLGFIDVAHF